MDEQDQNPFDRFNDFIKTEPETDTSQIMHNKYCLSDTKLNDFEYQTTEQLTPVEFKEEMIECEMPKSERRLDLPTKSVQDTVSENVQTFPKTIKLELENISDVKVIDIKQEVSEYIPPKTESEVRELLTSECDLPILKLESTDYYPNYYLGRKPLKNIPCDILKKKSRKYTCPICQKNFPTSKSRSTHIDGHFKKRFAVCQFCGKIMKAIECFQHFFIHAVKNTMKHNINDISLKPNLSSKNMKQKTINNIDYKSFKCDTCFKTFNKKSVFKKHVIIHSGEKPFKCDLCSKNFNRKSTLQRHLLIHSSKKPLKPFKCNICFKGFNYQCTLKQHLIIHNDEKPYECVICFKYFINKSNLQKHLILHSSERPYKCNNCFKGFTRKSHFQQHLMIHTSEKPFKCDICSKDFNYKPSLQRHLLIHKSEKPFKCDICSKGFNHKPSLQIHLLIHNGDKPYNCDICSKAFNCKSNLRKHLIIHGDEKPFKCDTCSKCFNHKSTLALHLLIHNGEKPYNCDICFKAFNCKSNLRKHLIIHGDEKSFKCE